MQVTVIFYGVLKQDVGTKQQALDLPGDTPTVGALADVLAARYPNVATRLPTVAFAVHDALVARDHVLREGDQVALLPPVSGG